MITSQEEYMANLTQLAAPQKFTVLVPSDEPIYKIDLNTRSVESPKLLSVTHDNEAEIILFKVDRYYGMQDLKNTTCLVIYTNALGESYMHNAYMDFDRFADENAILIAWPINSDVTKKAGSVKFAFKFYILGDQLEFDYLLHTKPAITQVVQGIEPNYTKVSNLTEEEFAGNASYAYYIYYKGQFVRAPAAYDPKQEYYILTSEVGLSPASRWDQLYETLQNMQKETLRWVEV